MANKNYETSEELVKDLKAMQCKTQRALSDMQNMQELLELTPKIELGKKKILNKEEDDIFICFVAKEGILNTTEYQIHPQVSMSAFVDNQKNNDKELADKCWYLYNKLYVDFLIITLKDKEPVCVIEYNGKGHNSEPDGLARDMVKKTICKKIGIPFIVLESIEGKEKQKIREYIQQKIIDEGPSEILKQ